MNRSTVLRIFTLTCGGLFLLACSSSPPTPSPDDVATRVAVERAAAETLTADAPTPIPSPTAAEPTPVPPTATDAPTAAPTDTPPPPPTQTPPPFDALPPDGTDGNPDLQGRIIFPGFPPGSMNPPIFRDRIVFRVEVYDVEVGTTDGAGIDYVNIAINDGEIFQKTEERAGYCVFGGGEPDCLVWVFADHGNHWPNGLPVESGFYDVEIQITPLEGEIAIWRFGFEIRLPDSH